MQANISTRSENASSANPLYTLAALSAFLFVIVSLAAIPFTDWDNPAATNAVAIVLNVVGYIAMMVVVVAVCQHLRPASAALSGIAAAIGVLALAGGATGSVVGFDTTLGMVGGIFASFGMLIFFGLSGYLALTSRLLPAGWAAFSILLGVLAAAAGVISVAAGSNSPATGIAWTVFSLLSLVWAVWTAVEFIRRGRAASAAA